MGFSRKIYILELAHAIMKAEFHYLPSTNWRTKKASGIIQFGSEGLRIRGSDGVSPSSSPHPENQENLCLKAGEDGYHGNKEQIHPFLAFVFYSGPQPAG